MSITDLPDELLLAILERTPNISGVLRIRATCRAFVPACSTTVRDRLKVLYIHPSPTSVQRAIKICQSDLGSEIEEICLVDKVFWLSIHRNPEWGLQYTWPCGTFNMCGKTLNAGFDEAYKDLMDSLAALTKLQALSFDTSCNKPGFNINRNSLQRIEACAIKIRPTAPSKELSAESKLYTSELPAPPQPRSKFADADALAAVINRFSSKLAKLVITEELPLAQAAMLQTGTLGNLTHVELYINTGWYFSDWHLFCRHILQSAASNLQDLKLSFQYNPAAARQQRIETSLAVILEQLKFHALKRLELYASFPLVQDFNLKTFLSERCDKLEVLRTTNVVALPVVYGPGHAGDMTLLDKVMLDIEREVSEVGNQG